MPKAKKMPSGSWRAEIEFAGPDGQRIRKVFTRKTKAEAESAAAIYRQERRMPDRRTVGEAISSYIGEKKPVLSPSTIRSYISIRNAIRDHYPRFWNTLVDDLTPNQLQKFINGLSAEHSPKTVRNEVALIGASLPARLNVRSSVTLPARVRPNYHIPTAETVQAILEAAKGTSVEIPVYLAVVCTMRVGEIAALEMSDISGNSIHVHRNKVRGTDGWVVKAPKTYSSDRIIEAPRWLIDLIHENGLPERTPASITRAFQRLLVRNNLPVCRFHDLRHYSASYMHAQGVPTAYIMQRGGWNTETVLNSVYRHALDDQQRAEAKKINDSFTELLK